MTATETRIIIPRERTGYDMGGEWRYHKEALLAQLLLDEVLISFTGTLTAEYDDETTLCLEVICSDIFEWGCAESEPVTAKELPALYEMHMADPRWGSVKWCILKRRQMPQPPVLRAMKAAGVWDLDESQLQPYVSMFTPKETP